MSGFTLPTTKLTIEVPRLLVSYIETLVDTGLYGNSVEEAAHEIIAAELRRLVLENKTFPRQWR